MYSKILFATDLSDASELMVDHLPHLIKVGLEEVILVHVVDIVHAGGLSGMFKKHDEEALKRQRAKLEQHGIKAKTATPIGFPAYEINRIAEEENVSLIMMGSHGRNVFSRMVMGGVGEQIIRDTRKPVLIMKFVSNEGEEGCRLTCENLFEAILYPTDFSNNAEKALPYIKKALDAGCKKVVLLHVQEEQRIKPHLQDRLEEFNRIDQDRLDRIKNELLDLGVKEVKTVIEMGKTTPIIMRVSQEEGACLIAIGAKGRSLMEEMFVGGTATNVVRHAKMPVLFVA